MMLITTLVVSFRKAGEGNVNVKLCFLVVYVRCEVFCRLVIGDNMLLLLLLLLLLSTETCYQLQPSDKELHTEHTPLRNIISH